MNIYFVYDEKSNAVKIGKANDIVQRLGELRVGNPNELILINSIQCNSVEESFLIESQLHQKYKLFHIRGEWFQYIPEFRDENIDKIIENRNKRDKLEVEGLFGKETLVDVNEHPRCYFYSHLVAQIMTNYEESLRMKNPYRTMEYPTHGKQMLLPYSIEVNRVFISGRKHEENLELQRYNKLKEPNSLIDFCK